MTENNNSEIPKDLVKKLSNSVSQCGICNTQNVNINNIFNIQSELSLEKYKELSKYNDIACCNEKSKLLFGYALCRPLIQKLIVDFNIFFKNDPKDSSFSSLEFNKDDCSKFDFDCKSPFLESNVSPVHFYSIFFDDLSRFSLLCEQFVFSFNNPLFENVKRILINLVNIDINSGPVKKELDFIFNAVTDQKHVALELAKKHWIEHNNESLLFKIVNDFYNLLISLKRNLTLYVMIMSNIDSIMNDDLETINNLKKDFNLSKSIKKNINFSCC